MQYGLGESDPLFEALAQRFDGLMAHTVQAAEVANPVNFFLFLHGVAETTDFGDKVQKLLHGHFTVNRAILRKVAYFLLDGDWMLLDVVPIHQDGPGRRANKAGYHFHGGRFSGAVWAQKPQDFATVHLETDSVDRID